MGQEAKRKTGAEVATHRLYGSSWERWRCTINGAELKHYNDLTTFAWWDHDETEDAKRELRILRDGARRLILLCSICEVLLFPSASDWFKRPARRMRR